MPFVIGRRHAYLALAITLTLRIGACLAGAAAGRAPGAAEGGSAGDDVFSLVQRSYSDVSSSSTGGGRQQQASILDNSEVADGGAAPPPMADGQFARYFGNEKGPHRPAAASSSSNTSGTSHLGNKIRMLGDLVRFGGVATPSNRSLEECRDFPKTCAPPFTCEHHEGGQQRKHSHKMQRLSTEDGRANVHSWCNYPKGYVRYAQQCAAGSLFHAAQELRKVQEERRRPDGSYPLLVMDAAYCFASGHCNDTSVTLHTTIPQAEALCDARYSRRAWTSVGPIAMAASPKRRGTDSAWGKVACAMGTYHCDIVYCRVYYCKDQEWRSRFGYLAQDDPAALEPKAPRRGRR